MLSASQDNSVNDSHPHLYLPEWISKLSNHATEVLQSNLLPEQEVFDCGKASYGDFLKQREEILLLFRRTMQRRSQMMRYCEFRFDRAHRISDQ